MNPEFGRLQCGGMRRPLPIMCDTAGCVENMGQDRDSHPVSTLEMVLEGEMTADYRGRIARLAPGDVILLAAGEAHRLTSEKLPVRRIFLSISGTGARTILDLMLGEQYIFHPDSAGGLRLRESMSEMIRMLKRGDSPVEISTALFGILAELSGCRVAAPDWELNGVLHFMESHLSQKLSENVLERKLGIPSARLNRLFREHLRTTPSAYFLHLRMRKAAELLNRSPLTVKEIASAVGYSASLTFSREFRKHFGQRPSEFRRQAVNGE